MTCSCFGWRTPEVNQTKNTTGGRGAIHMPLRLRALLRRERGAADRCQQSCWVRVSPAWVASCLRGGQRSGAQKNIPTVGGPILIGEWHSLENGYVPQQHLVFFSCVKPILSRTLANTPLSAAPAIRNKTTIRSENSITLIREPLTIINTFSVQIGLV